jgi:hypothetical protein
MSSEEEFKDANSEHQAQDDSITVEGSTGNVENVENQSNPCSRQPSVSSTKSNTNTLEQEEQPLPDTHTNPVEEAAENNTSQQELESQRSEFGPDQQQHHHQQLQQDDDELAYELIDIKSGLANDDAKPASDVTGEVKDDNCEKIDSETGFDPPLPDRKPIKDLMKIDQVDSILTNEKSSDFSKINEIQYDKNSSNYLLQAKFNQLNGHYKSLDQKQKDAVNSGTENIKSTFNSIKQTVGGLEGVFAVKIDWEFWEKVVNDYEKVILYDSDQLNWAIMCGIPGEFRGIIWQLILKSKNFQLEEFYFHLKQETSVHEKSIKRDLSRTSFFTNVDQVGKSQELFNVIKAYSLFDPDVGYTQGMIFITVPLIMNMTEAECFCLLVTLMKDYRIRELFCPEMKGLHLFLHEFDRLLETYSPLLYNHLVRQGIKSSMYASQWFLTFFAYKFPLDIVLRIYDILITQGSESILKFAVNLMIQNQSNLLLLKFDNLLEYLKDKMFNVYVNDEYITRSNENAVLPTKSKRFSILGTKKITTPKTSQQNNYYKLNELVQDSMAINIDPIDLEKYEQEFENIYRVEESKLLDIKETKIENGKLRKTIKQLEIKYCELNRDHVDIVQMMVSSKVILPEILSDNEDLKAQISQLQYDIQDLESKVQSPTTETGSASIGSGSGSGSQAASLVLPPSIENDISRLLVENAEQTEKYAELEDELSSLLAQNKKLSQELNEAKKQKWFGRWN